MKYFFKCSLIALLIGILITDDLSANSQNTSGILSTLHCALGVNVGGFKHSKRTKCEDDGQKLKGGYYDKTKYPSRFAWSNRSDGDFAPNVNVDPDVDGYSCDPLYHSCTGPDCKKRINYKGGVVFGSDFGVFLDLSRNFSFGAEVFVDFTKIKLQVNDDSYSCTNPNCQIKQVPLGYDPTVEGTDYQNFSELYCKHRFSSDRHYRANVTDNVRHYNKYFYGMLLVAKIYPQSGKCYLALKAGLAKNSYKGPVHVIDDNVTVHTYTRKKIKSRLGIVLKGEFGIFLTDNFAFSLNCGFQSNNQKDNVWSYRLEQAGMSAKFFFGR